MPDWRISETIAPDAYFQYIVGSARHPDTKLWQIWISFDGENIYWVAAHEHEEHIGVIKKELEQWIPMGEHWSREKAFAILNRLYARSEAEPQPLPQTEVMIRRNFVWR